MEHYDDFLEHFGVKGMRWGKHKSKKHYEIRNHPSKKTGDLQYTPTWGDTRTYQMPKDRLMNEVRTGSINVRRKGTSNLEDIPYMRTYKSWSNDKLYIENKRRKEKKSKERAKKKVELYLSSLKGK